MGKHGRGNFSAPALRQPVEEMKRDTVQPSQEAAAPPAMVGGRRVLRGDKKWVVAIKSCLYGGMARMEGEEFAMLASDIDGRIARGEVKRIEG